MLIETIVASLVPVGIEGVKQVINKWTGGVKPTTVAEQIQLDQSDVEKLKAVAALDNPYGTPSQWVVDLRASSRYIAAIGVIFGGLASLYIPNVPESAIAAILEAVGVTFGFLFGQRILVNRGK